MQVHSRFVEGLGWAEQDGVGMVGVVRQLGEGERTDHLAGVSQQPPPAGRAQSLALWGTSSRRK